MDVKYNKFQFECPIFEYQKHMCDKQGLKKHIRNVHEVSNEEELNLKLKNVKIIKSEKEKTIILNSKDEIDKLKEKELGEEFFDCEIGNYVKVCLSCPVESCKKKSKSLDNLMQHIRKTHNVNTKTARLFSK